MLIIENCLLFLFKLTIFLEKNTSLDNLKSFREKFFHENKDSMISWPDLAPSYTGNYFSLQILNRPHVLKRLEILQMRIESMILQKYRV